MWLEIMVLLIVFIALLILWSTLLANRSEIFCAWCQNPRPPKIRTPEVLKIPKSRGSLKMLSGKNGESWWHYRNVDGTRDFRVTENYQLANYHSRWTCDRCGATTAITHTPSSSPSIEKTPILVSLTSPGDSNKKLEGKRWGMERDSTNFWMKGYTNIEGPHRKGDEQ